MLTLLSISMLTLAFNAQLTTQTSSASGWLNDWSYRKAHVINPASGAGTNYQIKIRVNYSNGTDSGENVYLNTHSRTDFGDVRFTDDDGITELDYWMEEKVNGDYAIFWIEIPDDLSISNQTIYVYYSNPIATSTSDGHATFLIFDHFDDGDWSDRWLVEMGQPSEFVESGSTLTITTPQGAGRWSILRSNTPIDQGKICYMAKLRRVDSDPGECWELGQNLQDSWLKMAQVYDIT